MVRLELSHIFFCNMPETISIPKWYDWSFQRWVLISITHQFQFLNGTIGVTRFSCQWCFCRTISIPKWYDWSCLSVEVFLWAYHLFQFLNGTIGVITFVDLTEPSDEFQFLNGTIGVFQPNVCFFSVVIFQFLNGTIGVVIVTLLRAELANFNS